MGGIRVALGEAADLLADYMPVDGAGLPHGEKTAWFMQNAHKPVVPGSPVTAFQAACRLAWMKVRSPSVPPLQLLWCSVILMQMQRIMQAGFIPPTYGLVYVLVCCFRHVIADILLQVNGIIKDKSINDLCADKHLEMGPGNFHPPSWHILKAILQVQNAQDSEHHACLCDKHR